jgi:hypothetical protein
MVHRVAGRAGGMSLVGKVSQSTRMLLVLCQASVKLVPGRVTALL